MLGISSPLWSALKLVSLWKKSFYYAYIAFKNGPKPSIYGPKQLILGQIRAAALLHFLSVAALAFSLFPFPFFFVAGSQAPRCSRCEHLRLGTHLHASVVSLPCRLLHAATWFFMHPPPSWGKKTQQWVRMNMGRMEKVCHKKVASP